MIWWRVYLSVEFLVLDVIIWGMMTGGGSAAAEAGLIHYAP
jgi:hypothetical protein